MRNYIVLLLSLFSITSFSSLHVPERLGSVALFNSPNGFAVLKDKQTHVIEPDALDTTLRQMDYKQRSLYMAKGGGFILNQANTSEYTLKSAANIKGGGPIAGWVCWALVMAPGVVIIAIVNKLDSSGTAPTGRMFDNLSSVAKVAKSFGDTSPLP